MTTPGPTGRVHACTVNGHDAQHWYDEAQRWKREASSASHDGANHERGRWWRATGYEFVTWYEKDNPRA